MNIAGLSLNGKENAIWYIVQGSCCATELGELVKKDASVVSLTQDGWTPLHYACENRNITKEALEWLVKGKPDLNAVDEDGVTPLHLLCKNPTNLVDLIQYLVKNGANSDLKTLSSKKTPLHFLCENEIALNETNLKALTVSTSVNAQDIDENTPLHYLCNNVDGLNDGTLSFLLKAKANPNLKNSFEATAFHLFCQNSKITLSMLRRFLSSGADPNLTDNIQSTPCHYLCSNENNSIDLLDEIVMNGKANVLARNSFGKMPLDIVQESNDPECIALLEKYAPHRTSSSIVNHSRTEVGGEDVSSVDGVLKDALIEWNGSLPPFDQDFYTKICCDPSFLNEYNDVQQVSMKLHASPTDVATMRLWKEKLATWRKRILVIFLALMKPSLWPDQEKAYGRVIPSDVNRMKDKISAIWTQFPQHSNRRDRLDRINALVF